MTPGVNGIYRDPEERLARLVEHGRRTWRLMQERPEARDRARRWLAEHPSAWREVAADTASGGRARPSRERAAKPGRSSGRPNRGEIWLLGRPRTDKRRRF